MFYERLSHYVTLSTAPYTRPLRRVWRPCCEVPFIPRGSYEQITPPPWAKQKLTHGGRRDRRHGVGKYDPVKPSILVLHVEDERNVSDALETALRNEAACHGLTLNSRWQFTAAAGIAALARMSPDIVIVDYWLPHGMELGEDDFPKAETLLKGVDVMRAARPGTLKVWYTGSARTANERCRADIAISGTELPEVAAREIISRLLRRKQRL